jgi:nitroreductase
MEFVDVVMKRRAVRRFEEGGVGRDVIERIARLAQRTPSAGFSQGQRLIVVTEPDRRREVARICGEDEYEADFGPWISECAAQFIPCVSEAIYHRRYQEPDKTMEDGSEIEWPVPFWWIDIGATMQTIMLAAVDGASAAASSGLTSGPSPLSRRPDEFVPIGVMPSANAARCRSPLKRGWVPFEAFARWEARTNGRQWDRGWVLGPCPNLRAARTSGAGAAAGSPGRPATRHGVGQPLIDLAELGQRWNGQAGLDADPHDVVSRTRRRCSPRHGGRSRRRR